ncbi:MAG TPA: hypothetical protein VFJ12_00085 [Segeticoccus sp.]|jgi:hypothetical protein|nr:hypothetical protein [Segeticoccus sp.]
MTGEGAGGDPLTDSALQSEIELVGDLVAAASESEGPLCEGEIDRLLGVESAEEEPTVAGDDTAASVPAPGETGRDPAHGESAPGPA